MSLSQRASDFLRKSERTISLLTESEIRQAFEDNHAPIFEPLIEFQQRFGGYTFYAGLAPIKFSLLKGDGGYPKSSRTAIVEFELSERSLPQYFFDCASTDYQMQFFLDEEGVYYEDYKAVASEFEKVVEQWALWEEINRREDFQVIYDNQRMKTKDIDKELKLELLPEASDQYTLWFRSEYIYMQQRHGLTTLMVSDRYPEKARLLTL